MARLRAAEGRARHVVANGFEADPGAQVDRTLMELDPHLVVEGTALAAYAIGAKAATIVVTPAAPRAARPAPAARSPRPRPGYLGENVLGTGQSLWIDVRELTGSFVVGEETVLLRALEEKRAQPDQRPPYPSEKGLRGRPTVVNNVETLAAVPWIVTNGPSAFAAIGDPQEPGTTLVQLSGAVARPGILEVPTGTPLRESSSTRPAAAPVSNAQGLKALLVGGPSGGFLPPSALDTPLSRAALVAAGALPGSGSIVGIDGSSCIVDLATLMTRFLSDEACGKTIPCRIGTRRLAELGDGFCTGRCRPTDPDLLVPGRRRPRRRAVRPGGHRGQPAAIRNAILREGVRGPHRAWVLPSRRLPSRSCRGWRGRPGDAGSMTRTRCTPRSWPEA